MPIRAGRRAWQKVMENVPSIAILVDRFNAPLPPGKPPAAFKKLIDVICKELRERGYEDAFPLNDADHGRRSLLALLRRRQGATHGPDSAELIFQEDAPANLEQCIRSALFFRSEFDAHAIDIECKINVDLPSGGTVTRKVSRLWLLIEIEARSRAVMGFALRVGLSYDNLDVALCMAKAMEPWRPRELTIPDMAYAPGAGMPTSTYSQGLVARSRSTALDNALAHYAHALETGFCRARGGVMIFGKSHTPRSRPVVEQLFSRLARGALRKLPGGFEPATRLGEHKLMISNYSPDEHPMQLHLLEELLDVIIANYNATPHPALGNLSPLAFLKSKTPSPFEFTPDTPREDALDMASVLVSLTVRGDKSRGKLPYVSYLYVDYRCPELNDKWALIGTTILARVNRTDLRSIVLLRSSTQPFAVAHARSPWSATRHDETTRKLIFRWSKSRQEFSINGVDCAVAAFVAHLRTLAAHQPAAVDQLARIQQIYQGNLPARRRVYEGTVVRVPQGGMVSLDD
jgi:hypothetical protein